MNTATDQLGDPIAVVGMGMSCWIYLDDMRLTILHQPVDFLAMFGPQVIYGNS